jgi:hypothetical protein
MKKRGITFYDDPSGLERDQREAFLKLSPTERLNVLFKLQRRIRDWTLYPQNNPTRGIEIRPSHVD